MSLPFRPTHLFPAAACLCFALLVSPFAIGQAEPAVTQQRQNAQLVTQTQTSDSSSTKEAGYVYEQFGDGKPLMRVCRPCTVDEFATGVGIEDGQIQHAIQNDPEHIPVRTDYGKRLDIPEDEEKALHTIILDTYYRLKEIAAQYTADISVLPPPRNDAELKAKLAKRDELEQQETKILDESVAKLKQVLGEEEFKRLDEYVYFSSGRRNAVAVSSAGTSNSSQPGDNSKINKAPEVQR